jgi:hypothetical protein
MTSRESIIITSLAFSFKGQTFHREIFSSAKLYTSASGETSEYVRTPGIRAVALPAAGEKQGYAGNIASIIPDVLLLSADPGPDRPIIEKPPFKGFLIAGQGKRREC